MPDDRRLLDRLPAAGVDCDFSCGEGICGACETTVLDGEPEPRDCGLSEAEKAVGRSMIICVSGAKPGGRLVPDL